MLQDRTQTREALTVGNERTSIARQQRVGRDAQVRERVAIWQNGEGDVGRGARGLARA